MQRHQRDLLRTVIHAVDVRDQGDLFQETVQSRPVRGETVLKGIGGISPVPVEGHGLGDQFLNILCPGLGLDLSLLPEFVEITALIRHSADQFSQRKLPALFPEAFDHLREPTDLISGPAQCPQRRQLRQSIIEAEPLGCRKLPRAVGCGGTDAPLRDVQDTPHGHVVPPVGNGPEIRKDVLDLFSLVEIDAAHQLVGDAPGDALLLQKAGLGVGPVEHSVFPVLPVPGPAGDLPDHPGSFFPRRLKAPYMDQFPLLLLCPEVFFLPPPVVPDHLVRGVQDVPRRAVVLLQPDHMRARERLLKAEDVPDVRSAEFVDGLVIVPDHAEISVLFRQKFHQAELDCIGILVFIHHDIAETLLIVIQDVRGRAEQLHRLHKKIVEIQRVVLS